MKHITDQIHLVGLALEHQTTNQNNQASIDCGKLWQEFESHAIFTKIPEKLSNEIYAVYHSYDGDHTNPYSYFIGCRVASTALAPAGLQSLSLAPGNYREFVAKGVMPDCVANSWREIWNTDLPRTYRTDYEIYDEKSMDWDHAEVRIYLGVEA